MSCSKIHACRELDEVAYNVVRFAMFSKPQRLMFVLAIKHVFSVKRSV